MGNAHDYGYKFLFSAPEFVRDLIQGFVPDAYLHALDYSTLERVECRAPLKIQISSQLQRCVKNFLLIYHIYTARRNFFHALHLGEL